MNRRAWLAVATAVAVAACNGNSDFNAPAAGTVFVGMRDNFFLPETVTVARGKSVRWTNQGRDIHTVNVDALALGSDFLAPTWWFEAAFTEAGTFAYRCSEHPEMVGTLVVQ